METLLPIATVRYYGRADKRVIAAHDAVRRSGAAPAGLNPSSRVVVDAAAQCRLRVQQRAGHFRSTPRTGPFRA